jgi:hypothetical protein
MRGQSTCLGRDKSETIRFLDHNKLGMELRDILESDTFWQELMSGGKQDQVPCLRTRSHQNSTPGEDRWLYESRDIIRFLAQQKRS